MAEQIEEKVIFTGDASQLQSAFEQLVAEISRTREELRQYKDDKEKTAELTKKLTDQEMALVKVMQQNDNVIDASNVSYKQLNDILKDLNKTYKNTADEASRMDLAPSIKAINSELKGMDASIGNFQRNVGNYEGAINNASKNLAQSFRQISQSLPSLLESPEKFFMSLAQSIPNLVEAYRSIGEAQKAAAGATEKQVQLDKAEMANKDALAAKQAALNTAKIGSAAASQGEAKSALNLAEQEVKETQITVASAEADLKRIQTSKASTQANLAETQSVAMLAKQEAERADNEMIMEMWAERWIALKQDEAKLQAQLNELTKQEVQATEMLTTAKVEAAKAEKILEEAKIKYAATSKAVADGSVAMAAGEETATVATKGLTAAFSSFLLIATVVLTIIAIFGKDLVKWVKSLELFNNEAKEAARFQKEWNEEMKEGHLNAAKQLVDLQIYSKWATMASKSDKERTLAAKEVLKTMGSAVTQTNIAKVKNGEFAQSIDDVTKALIKQAQAEAMTAKITEKYKDVIDAMDKLAQAENGKLDFGGWMQKFAGDLAKTEGAVLPENWDEEIQEAAVEGTVKRAQANLDKVKEGFEDWLNKFLEEFNPSDLLFNGGNGPGGNGDNWFSKWELYIKEFEATLTKFQGEYEELDLANIWKYSAEGLKYYTKMYDEYIEHYSADEKQYREAQVNKQKYLNEFNEYHTKLQKQYLDSLKTEYEVEMDQLEEWHTVQVEIYKNAGEDTTGLEAEYTKRKQDIIDKYVDKYKNAMLEKKAIEMSVNGDVFEYNEKLMELEIQNLKDAMDKEIKQYERKGIETTNLKLHYAQEQAKIESKYAKESTDIIIANIQRQEDALKRRNQQMLEYQNTGGAKQKTEMVYAALGGTTMSDHRFRQNEIDALANEQNIWEVSMNEQIKAMKEVLESGKLVGQEKLEMDSALAEAERELALGTAEYQLQLNQMILEDTRQTTDEMLGYIQGSLQGLGGAFDDIYSAYETMYDTQVKLGKMSQEEAEKQLENYRGIKAASAAFDAFASAVSAYQSLAGIPVVGPALGAVAAAAALAAGMAQVKNIMATTKNNVPNGTDTYANAMPSMNEIIPQYTVNLTGKQDTDYLKNALTEKPIEAYVVESNVTAAQEIANKRNNETSW